MVEQKEIVRNVLSAKRGSKKHSVIFALDQETHRFNFANLHFFKGKAMSLLLFNRNRCVSQDSLSQTLMQAKSTPTCLKKNNVFVSAKEQNSKQN